MKSEIEAVRKKIERAQVAWEKLIAASKVDWVTAAEARAWNILYEARLELEKLLAEEKEKENENRD